jgi:hypothetical protein
MEDLPEPYVQAMLKGIVGVELAVAKLEDKFKLSQNRPAGDRPRIISALDAHGDPDSAAVAALMRSRAPAPSRQPSKPNKAATASGRAQASTGSATRRAQPA